VFGTRARAGTGDNHVSAKEEKTHPNQLLAVASGSGEVQIEPGYAPDSMCFLRLVAIPPGALAGAGDKLIHKCFALIFAPGRQARIGDAAHAHFHVALALIATQKLSFGSKDKGLRGANRVAVLGVAVLAGIVAVRWRGQERGRQHHEEDAAQRIHVADLFCSR
jgi:hypothetical protein